MHKRVDALANWLHSLNLIDTASMVPLAGDASMRRYYRVIHHQGSFVLMDAPPDKENCHPFVAVADAFAKIGLQVPQIIARDLNQGFLLLTDFGDQTYLQALAHQPADQLYKKAIDALLQLQTCTEVPDYVLPDFDEAMILRELHLFQDWFIIKHLEQTLTQDEQKILKDMFIYLTEQTLKQPQICVHRDYHSRNLMLLADGNVGILDFQDAVVGPISYDLVSLLKDCYVAWPKSQRELWIQYYYDKAMENKILHLVSFEKFYRWFELMGIQRHLKAIGIFARLHHLYDKPNYLQDIPRTLDYVTTALEGFTELKLFNTWLKEKINSWMPA